MKRPTPEPESRTSTVEVIEQEPFYVEVGPEKRLFTEAFHEKIPVMLKGPTGCGKTRFVERMAYEINQQLKKAQGTTFPLITVPCHEDLTADDLKGRHLLSGAWIDGAALTAVKHGALLYLDEIVESRQDTNVVIHPLADYRRMLIVEKLGKVYHAPDPFILVISYNPGYQRKTKDLKQSTKQRFLSITFHYPPPELETKIVAHEASIDEKTAETLVRIGTHVRGLKGHGLDEGASTRLLIHAGALIRKGVSPLHACEAAIINPLTDDIDVYKSLHDGLTDIVQTYFK